MAAQNSSSSSERAERAPPRRGLGQQQHGDGELRQRQRHAHDAGQAGRHAERRSAAGGCPPRSASFAAPATANTAASSRRASEQHGAHRGESGRIGLGRASRLLDIAPCRRRSELRRVGLRPLLRLHHAPQQPRSASRSSSSRPRGCRPRCPRRRRGRAPTSPRRRRQRQRVAAAVVRVALALDAAPALQLVDELHHRRAVDAQVLAEPALRARALDVRSEQRIAKCLTSMPCRCERAR